MHFLRWDRVYTPVLGLCWLLLISLISSFPVDGPPGQLDHVPLSEFDGFGMERGLLRRDNPHLKNWDIYQKYKKRSKTSPSEKYPDIVGLASDATRQKDPKDPTSHIYTFNGRTVTVTNVHLGQGGDGVVYKGSFNQKDVAVKLSSNALLLAQAGHYMRVLNERPNVLVVIDEFKAEFDDHSKEKKFFQITPLMDGSLFDWVRKASYDDWERYHKTIAQHALQGLVDMHKIGISHRDYKPDNIFVQKKDGDIHAFVADLDRATRLVETFTTGTGTEGYVSLEYMLGPSFDSKKGDVFAAAMSMMLLLFKKRAIVQPTLKLDWDTALWKAILDAQNSKWPNLRKESAADRIKRKVLLHDDFVDLLPGMDEELADVFAKAMCPEKERLTAQQLMDQLLPLLPFEPCA